MELPAELITIGERAVVTYERLKKSPPARWQPIQGKFRFHLHKWLVSHFDGWFGPVSYEIEARKNGEFSIAMVWECTSCKAVAVTRAAEAAR